jgi:beta-phosphoglucomutase-like phosphatase (HAD superfamily)
MSHGLRVAGLADFFGDKVFSSYEVGHWKPEPHLFLHAARMMGYPPEDCLVVEDSDPGLHAAKAAGMRAIHYCPGSVPKSAIASAYVSDLLELPEVVRRLAHAA